MIIDSLAPVFALILLGKLLSHFNIMQRGFMETADRLVYYIFFPALLFWKIGGLSSESIVNWNLFQATVCTILTVFGLSLACVRFVGLPAVRAGAFSQSTYRANTYIGMAVVINALGEEAAGRFGMFLGLVIPFVNVLAVSTFIWYSEAKPSLPQRLLVAGKALLANPLILACFAGLLVTRLRIDFSPLIENSLQLTASLSLPLALLSIGGSLTTRALDSRLASSVFAAAIKVLVLPAIGFGYLHLFGAHGLSFQIGMIFFALPIAPSAYVLAAQLQSDKDLASASIVMSTVMSLFSLSAVLWMMK